MAMATRPTPIPLTPGDVMWREHCAERFTPITAIHRARHREYIEDCALTRENVESSRTTANCGYVARFIAGGPLCQYNRCDQCSAKGSATC